MLRRIRRLLRIASAAEAWARDPRRLSVLDMTMVELDLLEAVTMEGPITPPRTSPWEAAAWGIATATAVLAASLSITYALALAGEPRSLWLMGDVLGWV